MTRNWKRLLLIGVAVAVVLVVGGPFVYIHFFQDKAPAPLTVSASPQAATGAAVPADGTWKAASGSQAGYRVKEVLFGQNTEAVGRTNGVTGDLTIAGTKATKGSFTVDLTTVKSDKDRRDQQFQGRIMETAKYPKATFTLTEPIDLGSVPAVGAKINAKATGNLTLKAETRKVTFDVAASRTAPGAFDVSGSIPVKFADWKIANPSFGPIQTQDNGQVEFLLKFTK
ncbi:YceI family protein [Actinoallomurus sp. NPDC050550]|uniref:YceI family protein n=1 Tax=Actinoallomurus sp. NPDC050550 TaxID=3154937 RepID=UPI0033E81724